jgi:hypothetical protein
MNFTDTQLQACFERNLVEGTASTPSLNQVRALIATHDWFSMLEGAHSTRVHDTIDLLLSPGLRAGLRSWYGQTGAELNPTAVQFRDHLSQLAGEKFEKRR